MFTGIIQAVGRVREPEKLGSGLHLTIVCPPAFDLKNVHIGDSIAVNGACMTVVSKTDESFSIDVSAESLSKTCGLNTFGEVNLEKALKLGDSIDGHLVSGHVDGVGQVESFEKIDESYRLIVRAPVKLSPYFAYKGSVAVNGVSLTINSVEDTAMGALISINLIPHTVAVTTLKNLKVQDMVNLEVDTIARCVERMMRLQNNAENELI